MRTSSLLFLSVLLAGMLNSLSGMAQAEFNSTAMDGVNFASYTTYAWLPYVDSIKSSGFEGEKLDGYITEAVDREMQKRGYVLDNDNPELYLQYMIAIENTTRTETKATYGAPNMSVGMGFGRGGPSFGIGMSGPRVTGHESFQVKYREGSMVLAVHDIANDQTIWKGFISTIKEDKGQLVNQKAVIDELIPQLFKKYPKVKRK